MIRQRNAARAMRTIRIEAGRGGFTLVELLVAMALTLFIMVIITNAYTTGLETFRQLKGIGDLQEKLRVAAQRIREDLGAAHFDSNKRLSDFYLWRPEGRPRHGFFRIVQETRGVFEGTDLDGIPSYRVPEVVKNQDRRHLLHFSVRLRGNRAHDFFKARVPLNSPFDPSNPKTYKPTNFFDQPDTRLQTQGIYSSQWGEIAYFPVRTGWTSDPTDPNAGTGTPLYSIYRIQRVVVPDNSQIDDLLPASELPKYAAFSAEPHSNGKLHFNSPADLAQGKRSIDLNTVSPATPGASLLMTNVVSFRIQVLRRFGTGRPATAFSDLGGNFPAIFDTAQGSGSTIVAIKIELRVWDEASLQTRQITLIQDM